jgi:hypothetical protein
MPSNAPVPPAETPNDPRPASLGPHVVPPERLSGIVPHAKRLGEAAREIGDDLPFEADAADFLAVLEAEGE